MVLPIFSSEQPSCMYYYSPMTVNNLGMVDHAHKYPAGTVGEHMNCHVYTNAIGKKGANNMASLIMKTLRHLNLLQNDSIGSKLNIVFDNCCGQNKNYMVLRLAVWLMQLGLGYFLKLNFIFLVVSHTKNAADRLVNSLKIQYWKKNLYTFDQLVEALVFYGLSQSIQLCQMTSSTTASFLISLIKNLQVRLSRITFSVSVRVLRSGSKRVFSPNPRSLSY
jgi:hypothetical protein